MALDFPVSPTNGQQYPSPPVGGVPVYTYDGEKWTTRSTGETYVRLAGDTMTGTLTVSPATAVDARIDLKKSTGTVNNVISGYNGTLGRWAMHLGNANAESAGDNGSDFGIQSFTNAGVIKATPFQIARANGSAYFSGIITAAAKGHTFGVNGGTAYDGALSSSDANIKLYDIGGNNWSGMGTDIAGNFWIRTGTTGAVGAALTINPSRQVFVSNGISSYHYYLVGGLSGGFQNKTGDGNVVSNDWFNLYWYAPSSGYLLYVDNTSLGVITTSSDYRIKKDIAPLQSMWETVKLLNPISYTHKDFTPPIEYEKGTRSLAKNDDHLVQNDDIERWGFIAHELQETLTPSVAGGTKDMPNGIQNLNLAGVVAALTKALQEAMARIEVLEA